MRTIAIFIVVSYALMHTECDNATRTVRVLTVDTTVFVNQVPVTQSFLFQGKEWKILTKEKKAFRIFNLYGEVRTVSPYTKVRKK